MAKQPVHFQTGEDFLHNLFECSYCEECGGDADDHNVEMVLGNYFARCIHPIPSNLSDAETRAEYDRRIERQEAGLPIVETPG